MRIEERSWRSVRKQKEKGRIKNQKRPCRDKRSSFRCSPDQSGSCFSHQVISLHRLTSPLAAVKICEIYNLNAQWSRAKRHQCFTSICWKHALHVRSLTGVSERLKWIKVCESLWKLASLRWRTRVPASCLTEPTEDNKADIVVFTGEELHVQTGNVCGRQHIPVLSRLLKQHFFPAEQQKRRAGWKFRQKAVFESFPDESPEHLLRQLLNFSNSFEPHPNDNLVSLFSSHPSPTKKLLAGQRRRSHILMINESKAVFSTAAGCCENYVYRWASCQKAHTHLVDLTRDTFQFISVK